jgi:hypothetical protein
VIPDRKSKGRAGACAAFAVGPKGHEDKQVSGDSGSGATLGGFKPESTGVLRREPKED